jgi:hypothetical protein
LHMRSVCSHDTTFVPSDTEMSLKGGKNYECVCPLGYDGRVCANVHTASRDCFRSFAETFRITEVLSSFSNNSGRAPIQSHLFKKMVYGIPAEVSELWRCRMKSSTGLVASISSIAPSIPFPIISRANSNRSCPGVPKIWIWCPFTCILPKSSAIVVVPPAHAASTCFDSGSRVWISVVFPAPKGPKTTILHLFSSVIRIKFDGGSFYHFGKNGINSAVNGSFEKYPDEHNDKG